MFPMDKEIYKTEWIRNYRKNNSDIIKEDKDHHLIKEAWGNSTFTETLFFYKAVHGKELIMLEESLKNGRPTLRAMNTPTTDQLLLKSSAIDKKYYLNLRDLEFITKIGSCQFGSVQMGILKNVVKSIDSTSRNIK
ncbi:hypothetical protein CRE_07264 [Caenorhabditis remanei]|uniref:Uncharacterized protein n=1 Tax=Caenorhabditis remanei TaxID=31234 RepID=E3M2I5_CAERE|nr:hypothetical protein CRE_07264 [Caenorhabditis remanei]